MKNIESQFESIDKLVAEVKDSSDSEKLLSDFDSLCDDIDQGFEGRKREIAEWSNEQKREFAADGNDSYVLNLLSMDENLKVRTLALCNPNTPENSIRRALEETSDYIRLVIANNPNSPSDVLDRLTELTNEPEVLDAVKRHPNVSEATKYKIENRMV